MRTERDSMGEMEVPDFALFGASTQRAVLNFPISGHRLPQRFIEGLALIKKAAATANCELALLEEKKAHYICEVADEILSGRWADQFPLDVFQTGSATSTNMNINEVIAHRAAQLAREKGDTKTSFHPNDDVNRSQSSNDIIPTTLHVSVALILKRDLKPALEKLRDALIVKSREFDSIVKIGRTHLMDATPMTLGQEFSGYAMQLAKAVERVDKSILALQELAVGGTAVGTGINCHPEFAARVCQILALETGLSFREARNHFEAQGARDDSMEVAGHLSTIAGSLKKIANDIRFLASGPRSGIQEIRLPATQPGSSIMPGKVNPVMCEMMVQTCTYIQGLATMVSIAGSEGHFELNVNLPLIAYALHESVRCLSNAAAVFTKRCVEGIEANAQRCEELVQRSLMLVTALNPFIGYDAAAGVAKEAYRTGKSLREVVLAKGLMAPADLDAALDPVPMTKAGLSALGGGGG